MICNNPSKPQVQHDKVNIFTRATVYNFTSSIAVWKFQTFVDIHVTRYIVDS
jgi:hypothetical protein